MEHNYRILGLLALDLSLFYNISFQKDIIHLQGNDIPDDVLSHYSHFGGHQDKNIVYRDFRRDFYGVLIEITTVIHN